MSSGTPRPGEVRIATAGAAGYSGWAGWVGAAGYSGSICSWITIFPS
ncbi:hypothetical protein CCANI_02640 [Corynebacterium canis]|nr:hypothetical protein CCANI_02640 [Corynebacterium canis]